MGTGGLQPKPRPQSRPWRLQDAIPVPQHGRRHRSEQNVCTMTPDEREGNATEGETKRTSHTCRPGGEKNGYFFVISDVCRGAAAVRWLVCCCCYLRQNPRTAMTATCTGELPGISIIKGETKQRAGVIPLPLKKGEILAALS